LDARLGHSEIANEILKKATADFAKGHLRSLPGFAVIAMCGR